MFLCDCVVVSHRLSVYNNSNVSIKANLPTSIQRDLDVSTLHDIYHCVCWWWLVFKEYIEDRDLLLISVNSSVDFVSCSWHLPQTSFDQGNLRLLSVTCYWHVIYQESNIDRYIIFIEVAVPHSPIFWWNRVLVSRLICQTVALTMFIYCQKRETMERKEILFGLFSSIRWNRDDGCDWSCIKDSSAFVKHLYLFPWKGQEEYSHHLMSLLHRIVPHILQTCILNL